MNLKTYQNELIIFVSFFLMVGAFFFKQTQIKSQAVDAVQVEHSIAELKEVIGLTKIWKDKKISKKILKLKTLINSSKVRWSKKANKVTASFKNLTDMELNRLVTKILNLAVEIQKLKVQKVGSSYLVEFKCKW